MNEIKFEELNFNGVLIQLTQSSGFDMMINATEMAKPFGPNKQPAFWLRLKEAKNYIDAFTQQSTLQNLQNTFKPVITVVGNYADGTRQGTWMHRWVTLEFARWLDPSFAVWCNQKIDELLRNGFTTALQEERDRYNALLPQVNFCNQVLQSSENLYSTEQICKDLNLGISSKTLLARMRALKLIYKRQDGKWFLSSEFDKFGYLKTVTIIDKKTQKPRNIRRWTENGRYWIWSLKGKLG